MSRQVNVLLFCLLTYRDYYMYNTYNIAVFYHISPET